MQCYYPQQKLSSENVITWVNSVNTVEYTGCTCIKKKVDKSVIALCFAKRLNVRCFFIKIDCFGTFNLE